MDKAVKFSIIIPAYNVEKYIGECIESILNQSYEDYEVIVVDDGSTDKTTEIVQQYSQRDARIKTIKQNNGGPSKARNIGIQRANGEYILFVDSDDMYKNKEALSTIASKCSGVDIVAYGWEEFDESGTLDIMMEFPHDKRNEVRRDSEIELTGKNYLESALENNHQYAWYSWRYAFRTKYWKDGGFHFTEGIKYEDVRLIPWVILQAEKIVCIEAVLYRYRLNRIGAITMDRTSETDLNYLSVIVENIREAEKLHNMISPKLQTLLCNNFSDMYYTVMILCSCYRKEDGYKQVLKRLEEDRWITKYTIDRKQKLVRNIINVVGIDKAVLGLGVRKKLRHGKRQ